MTDLVVDISHHQGDVDFNKLKGAGVLGVILKASQGSMYKDDRYDGYVKAARAAGLMVAAYHFLVTGTDVKAQMAWFLACANLPEGSRLVIDFETNTDGKGPSIRELEDCVRYMINEAGDRYEITVYGANGYLGAMLNGDRNEILAEYTSLWVASYTTASSPTMGGLKGTWPVWSLWQYSDKGSKPGVSGPVDVNRWNGSVNALRDWFVRPADEDDIEPEPLPPPVMAPVVTIDVAVPDGVALKIYINGQLQGV